MKIAVKNARIFTPIAVEEASNWNFKTYDPGFLVCDQEKILSIGQQDSSSDARLDGALDAEGCLITPGFVDCHTHPVFLNYRAHEFEKRIKGDSYLEISKAGGGIRFSVRDLRKASKEQLLKACLDRLDRFAAHGTTTIEAKSGYGLTIEDEIKSLTVIRDADALHAVELVPTFLGAHEVPDEFRGRREDYVTHVIEEMLPRVVEEDLAQFIDVFCEDHVFSDSDSLKILRAGKAQGLRPKIHADQLHNTNGARVAAQVGAVSADHLEFTPPEVDERLAEANVIPVMLPGADFFLNSEIYGPARRMIDAGLHLAIATDFNPGTCMTESMQMILTLACLKLKLSPAEALIASTLHAAKAISRDKTVGSLEIGKQADFVIWDAKHEAELPYHFGVNLVGKVYKKGKLAFQNTQQKN